MQDGQQQVLFLHALLPLYTGFEYRQLQHVARLFVEHQVGGVYRLVNLVLTHFVLQFGLHRLQVDVQSFEEVDHRSFACTQQSQQQVFRSYRPAGQSGCFLPAIGENLGDFR